VLRRLRIVSLPPTDYIRYEHAVTPYNIEAGEDVRWLSRRDAADLALPGADCWIFDGTAIRWSHFAGDGAYVGEGFTADPKVSAFCAEAFEKAWARAVRHAEFVF